MAFPATLDTLATSYLGTDQVSVVDHAGMHNTTNVAVNALESKVGVNGSAVATSLDYLLKNTSSLNPGHKHTAVNITDFSTAADARITAQKGLANGLATLDGSGLIPTSQLPALAITDTFVVASQAAMLALTAETGDVAVRTDLNKSYILTNNSPSLLASWQELLTPTDAVLSVNGFTGAITLTTTNIAEGTNLYYTNARADARIALAVGATVQAWDATLDALAALSATGFVAIGASGTAASSRTLTAGSTKVSIANGNGSAGNPTIDIVEGNINHANLANLTTGDPHTQYGLKSGTLAQFAATTSAQLAGIISDETGSGALVFATSPTFVTQIITPLIYGSAASGGTLTLQSTSNATKGKILFGNSAYDEANNRLGIGTTSPSVTLQVSKSVGVGGSHGLSLTNTSPATLSSNLPSPTFRLTANGWKTNATAGSQPVDFGMYVLPATGAASPTGLFVIGSRINDTTDNGGYTTNFIIGTDSRVGINTLSPLAGIPLTLAIVPADESNSSTPNGAIAVVNDGSAPNNIMMSFGLSDAFFGSTYAWIQSRGMADTNHWPIVLNPSGGNVGIGVFPSYPLDVLGQINASGAITGASLTSTALTQGSIVYVGSGGLLSETNAQMFFDATNNTVSFGTTRSTAISGTNPKVLIKGSGASSATSSFGVQDSGAAALLHVRNDGLVGFGTTAPTAVADLSASTTARASLRIRSGTAPTSPNDGDVWNDSTQKTEVAFLDGIKQFRVGTIFTQTADKTVTNTVTETSIVGTGVGTLTLPANFFVAGKTIRLRIGGIYSTPIGAPSVVVKIKLGATVIATITTTALASGAANLEFDGEVLLTCRTTGASGTVVVHGDIEYVTGLGTIAVDSLNNAGATTTVDTTASKLLDVTVTWDSATTTRIVKSTVCTTEVLS